MKNWKLKSDSHNAYLDRFAFSSDVDSLRFNFGDDPYPISLAQIKPAYFLSSFDIYREYTSISFTPISSFLWYSSVKNF